MTLSLGGREKSRICGVNLQCFRRKFSVLFKRQQVTLARAVLVGKSGAILNETLHFSTYREFPKSN